MAKNTSIFKDAFSAIDKLNEDSSVLTDNVLSVVNNHIDTGSYALNAIVSGSLYKGIQEGRVIGLVGPTGCGKTLILNKIIANKQRQDPDAWGIIWDSEAAHDPQAAINVGANPDRIKICPIEAVEECRNQIVAFLDSIKDNKSLHGKVIIGIDSLGNLASTKEIEDAKKGKAAVDMGMRAKAIKSMMRTLIYKAAKTDTTIIFTNHIYDDPAAMFPSLVKSQSGGKGPLYLASVLIQLAQVKEKSEPKDKDEVIPIAKKYKGVSLRALTVKNRFVPPFLETSLSLNFKTGLYKYAGLLEMAVAYGIINQTGATYVFPDGTKLGYESKFKNDTKLWEEKILPELDKKLQEELIYSNESIEQLATEVDELDAEETEEDE